MPIKRSIFNLNITYAAEFPLIDHMKFGSSPAPKGATFETGEPWNKNLDANGWPQSADYDNRDFGGLFYLPSLEDYDDDLVFYWEGEGRLQIVGGETDGDPQFSSITMVTATGATEISSGFYDGTDARVVVSLAGGAPSGKLNYVSFTVKRTNHNAGGYFKNLRCCWLSDEADMLDGKIFRAGWKDTVADFNPGAIRCMNWCGGNDAQYEVLWSKRRKFSMGGWGVADESDFKASPPYPESTGTNVISVASATGMPVAMQHGEIATFRLGASSDLYKNTAHYTITGITIGANGRVTTSAAHNYETGDLVVLSTIGQTDSNGAYATITVISPTTFDLNIDTSAWSYTPAGADYVTLVWSYTLSEITAITAGANGRVTTAGNHGFETGDKIILDTLGQDDSHLQVATITKVSSTQFDLNLDTSGWSYTPVDNSHFAVPYMTLNVGARGAYPIASVFGKPIYLALFEDGGTASFMFDKELITSVEQPSGGTWIHITAGGRSAANGGTAGGMKTSVPIEVMVSMINELMEVYDARTLADPTDTYEPTDLILNIPCRAMCSMDPDYDADEHWAVNMLDLVLNGSVDVDPLDDRCKIVTPIGNEFWNAFGGGFAHGTFYKVLSYQRIGGSLNNQYHYQCVRSKVTFEDIEAAYPTHIGTRILRSMEGWGTAGHFPPNDILMEGATTGYTWEDDPLVDVGEKPSDFYEIFFGGTYIQRNEAVALTDYVTDWTAATTDYAKEEVCRQFIYDAMYLTDVPNSFNESIQRYSGSLLIDYVDTLDALGKKFGSYEGGWDVNTQRGDLSADEKAFLYAVRSSRSWGSYISGLHEQYDQYPNVQYPADYNIVGTHWGHGTPSQFANDVDGENLDIGWTMMGLRNRGKRRMRLVSTA